MTSSRRQSGLAAVEFALCAPVLLLLMLATGELVRAFTQYSTLAHAVRNSVRHVAGKALLGETGTIVITPALLSEARNLVVYGNVAGTGTPQLPGLSTASVLAAASGTVDVQVSATYAYQPLLGGSLPFFGYGTDPSTRFTFSVVNTMRAL